MTDAIHLISQVPPIARGGLELWTRRFAQRLAKRGTRVVVYVCSDQPEAPDWALDCEVVHLSALRSVWEEPIDVPVWTERFAQERGRLNFLVLRNEVRRQIGTRQEEKHLLVSNYSVAAGYLAALVARDLSLPHIAMVVGTDFSRGFHNSRERPILEHVCRTATAVVVKNGEQQSALTAEFGLARVFCIPTAVEAPATIMRKRGAQDHITLLSDCGFSFKKGTGVLLDSFQALLADGFPLRLIIYGEVAADQAAYWTRRQAALKENLPARVEFPGNVPREEVFAALSFADIYCSATLGEGSSSGRIAAVCAGVPVVTTRCGEMVGIDDLSHVRLSNVADAKDFLWQLRAMVEQVMKGTLRIDVEAINRWRERYSSAREASDWAAVIDSVADLQ